MAGIIKQAAAEGQDYSPAGVRAQMPIPQDKKPAYEAAVAVAKKILYAPQMDKQIGELLNGEGDIGQKLGTGVVGLMALVVDRMGQALPGDMVIPAGVEMVAEAAEYLKDSGVEVTDADKAEGVGVFIEGVLQKAGVNLDQLAQGGQPQPEQPQQPQPGAM